MFYLTNLISPDYDIYGICSQFLVLGQPPSYLYANKLSVSYQEHAVTRNRFILAKSLGYSIDDLSLDYGIASNPVFNQVHNELAKHEVFQGNGIPEKSIIALHGTSRINKEWPIEHWNGFIEEMGGVGYSVLFPWGNNEELAHAQAFAKNHRKAIALPGCSLTTLAELIQNASAVIGMDTGLLHVAAAFDQKGVALYPATEFKKIWCYVTQWFDRKHRRGSITQCGSD